MSYFGRRSAVPVWLVAAGALAATIAAPSALPAVRQPAATPGQVLPRIVLSPRVVHPRERVAVVAAVPAGASCRLTVFSRGFSVSSKPRESKAGSLEFTWRVPRTVSRGSTSEILKCSQTQNVARARIRAKTTRGSHGPQILARRIRVLAVRSHEPPSVGGLGGSGYPAYGSVMVHGSDWFGGHGVDVYSDGRGGSTSTWQCDQPYGRNGPSS